MLTRAEMEQVIREGGSVLHQGRLYTRMEELPSLADLAKGDPEKETAAANEIQEQIANLQAQLDKLTAPGPSAIVTSGGTPSTPSTPPSEDPIVSLVGRPAAVELAGAGYGTPESLSAATDEQLLAVPGIGDATLKKIRAAYPG